jgi:Glycosyl hydrolase catalytic core
VRLFVIRLSIIFSLAIHPVFSLAIHPVRSGRSPSLSLFSLPRPNHHDQAAIDVGTGIYLWNTYIAPLASQGYNILGSPAPTSAPDGLTWLQDFLNGVSVKPNVISVHWYGVGFDSFQQYVTNFYTNTGSRPIWVTEFACQNFIGPSQCSEGDVWNFVKQATAWMDETPWIQGYAPFGAFAYFDLFLSYILTRARMPGFMRGDLHGVSELNRLMNPDGSPTTLGSFFVNSS